MTEEDDRGMDLIGIIYLFCDMFLSFSLPSPPFDSTNEIASTKETESYRPMVIADVSSTVSAYYEHHQQLEEAKRRSIINDDKIICWCAS